MQVIATDTRQLAADVLSRAQVAGETLATIESCTGGLVAHLLTSIAGSSAVFLGGLVTYSNGLKESLLGVEPGVLARHGAVSEACVRQMALGGLVVTGASLGVAITGIAGPSGGTPDKPVGTVFWALAQRARPARVVRGQLRFDRAGNQGAAAVIALTLLLRLLEHRPLLDAVGEITLEGDVETGTVGRGGGEPA